MTKNTPIAPALILLILGSSFVSAFAGNGSSVMGEPFKELSTLHCLGVRWKIKGDDNKNAVIEVKYRQEGDKNWKQGFPLFRTMPNYKVRGAGEVKRCSQKGEWMFAGSVVRLTPDTAYEVKLQFKDPDGGEAERLLKMRTWKEPLASSDIVVKHVIPGKGGGTGSQEDPFKGLPATESAAQPGTLFLLHKGTYIKGNFPNDTWSITKSGLPGKPIIYRGAGDGEAILDGGGDHSKSGTIILMDERKHLWFENLTIRGRHFGIGAKKASHLVVRGCKIRECVKFLNAINGSYTTCTRFLIIDNDFKGSTTWPRTKGIEAYAGTKISGAGHIIAYNKFRNMGDGVHGTSHGKLSASDYHNNDLSICTDDGLETDYGEFNIRVFENRMVNVVHGITAQPIFVGPTYLFNNFMYNVVNSPFKLHNDTTGVLLIHNTCVKGTRNGFSIIPGSDTVLNVYTRNNLFIGKGGAALWTGGTFGYNDFDSDGYGGWKGNFTRWNGKKYKSSEDAGKAGVCYVKRGAFKIDPATCFASGLIQPEDINKTYPAEIDFSLAEKSDAVDKGEILPNFNDGFTGSAPDLGALEFGAKPPHFGPRLNSYIYAKK